MNNVQLFCFNMKNFQISNYLNIFYCLNIKIHNNIFNDLE